LKVPKMKPSPRYAPEERLPSLPVWGGFKEDRFAMMGKREIASL